MSFGRISPVLSSCATFGCMALMGRKLTASLIFTCLAAFMGLRLPAISFPMHLSMGRSILLSFQRINEFLLTSERVKPKPPSAVLFPGALVRLSVATLQWPINPSYGHNPTPHEDKDLERLSGFEEQRDAFSLNSVDLSVDIGEMVGIVGAVGCGKTTILMAMLGDVDCIAGTLQVDGNLGYVPQTAFIMSGTVLDNILMGRHLDEPRLTQVLTASHLEEDLKSLNEGLSTEVGERGVTLSGGQMQRVSIARSLYGMHGLVLMDDPLAAVDVKVGRGIFQSLKRLTVKNDDRQHRRCGIIMSLNQLSLLPEFDRIYFIEGGKVAETGTYDELVSAGKGFSIFVQSGLSSKDTDDAPDSLQANTSAVEVSNGFQREIAEDDNSSRIATVSKAVTSTSAVEDDEPILVVEPDASAQLVKKDHEISGGHSTAVLSTFFQSMGRGYYPGVTCVALLCYATYAFQDYYLTLWVIDAETKDLTYDENMQRNYVYISAAMAYILLLVCVSVLNTYGGIRAGRMIHDQVLSRLIAAPLSFWERTPSGRIISRFSGDLGMVDTQVIVYLDDLTHFLWNASAIILVVCILVPPTVVPIVIAIPFYATILIAVDRTNREAKRVTNDALSPILTLVSESVQGRHIVDTLDLYEWVTSRNMGYIDAFNRSSFFSHTLINFNQLSCSFISSLISSVAVIALLSNKNTYKDGQAAYAGLALTYSFVIPYFLMLVGLITTMFFTAFTGLQRISEYNTDFVPREKNFGSVTARFDEKKHAQDPWPIAGDITFEDASLVYRTGLKPALRGVSFAIEHGQRVGVVGRTGSGKSSLLVLLFRIVEASAGRVMINARDVAGVDLQRLRSSCAVIPQSPVTLTGSVRRNLDPFYRYTDEEGTTFLRETLSKVGLDPNVLTEEIGGSGSNLSIGELQLLSLARALLRKAWVKILVMDEPTANMDMATDERIQAVIRREFTDCTVITIAHRLSTIVDSDVILVMDRGELGEYGSPADLLRDRPEGLFAAMIDAHGPQTAAELRQRAGAASSRVS